LRLDEPVEKGHAWQGRGRLFVGFKPPLSHAFSRATKVFEASLMRLRRGGAVRQW